MLNYFFKLKKNEKLILITFLVSAIKSAQDYNNMLFGKGYFDTKYQIEISIKERKYKFDIISMQNYYKPSIYSSGGWTVIKLFNGNKFLNKSLFENINSNVKKSDGW